MSMVWERHSLIPPFIAGLTPPQPANNPFLTDSHEGCVSAGWGQVWGTEVKLTVALYVGL